MGGTSPLTPKMSKRSRESLRWLFVRLGKGSKKVVIFHGHKAKLLFRLWGQCLIKILKLMLRWDLEAEVWSVFCCWCLVEVTKLNLGQDSEARFDQDFKFSRDTDVWCWFWSKCLIAILKLKFDQDLCENLWYELNSPRVRFGFGNVFLEPFPTKCYMTGK